MSTEERVEVQMLVRVRGLTIEEWNALRKSAIDAGLANTDHVGSILRDYLRANGYTEREETEA